jgi:hypothetical protein
MAPEVLATIVGRSSILDALSIASIEYCTVTLVSSFKKVSVKLPEWIAQRLKQSLDENILDDDGAGN